MAPETVQLLRRRHVPEPDRLIRAARQQPAPGHTGMGVAVVVPALPRFGNNPRLRRFGDDPRLPRVSRESFFFNRQGPAADKSQFRTCDYYLASKYPEGWKLTNYFYVQCPDRW